MVAKLLCASLWLLTCIFFMLCLAVVVVTSFKLYLSAFMSGLVFDSIAKHSWVYHSKIAVKVEPDKMLQKETR